MVICLARGTLFERRPKWGSAEGPDGLQQDLIRLETLSGDDSTQLIDQILKIDVIPDWLYQLIQNNAEGNPYYIEEIIKDLIEESILVRDADQDRWRVDAARMGEVKIPPTLNALLQARLDRLPVEEKRTLQQASVVGRIFWDAVLWAIRSGSGSTGLEGPAFPELAALQRRDLVYPQRQSAFTGAEEYSFKHSLLRETAYQTLLKTNRKVYHALTANWLLSTSRASHREDEYTAIIAEHFDKAGETGQAAEWYLRAGELAIAKASAQEALAFFERALKLVPASDLSRRWRSLLGKSEALGILGDTAARLETDRELVALAHKLDDERCLGQAYYRQGFYLGIAGDYNGERLAYDRAFLYAERAGDRELEALVLGLKAIMLSRQGDLNDATSAAENALIFARNGNNDDVLAKTLINIGVWYSDTGDIGKSIQLLTEGVQISEKLGNQQGVAVGLVNLGYYYMRLGVFDQGYRTTQQALDRSQANGLFQYCTTARLNLGLNLLRLKDAGAALELLDQTMQDSARLGDAFSQAVCHTYTGIALEQMGDHPGARQHFSEAHMALSEMGVQSYAVDALAGLARCDLVEGRIDNARTHAVEIWQVLDQNGSVGLEAPILAYLTCARVFEAGGDLGEARMALEKGVSDLNERANKITNLEWRLSFLESFPEHNEIIEMWRQSAAA